MNLNPTETERLLIFTAARFAERNLADGVLLSHPEAVAYLTDWMLHAARRGLDYAEIVDAAGHLLARDKVEPGVGAMIPYIMAEGNFAEGTKMMVVFDPIGPGAGDEAQAAAAPIPGQVLTAEGEIDLVPGRDRIEVMVTNTADRDIQVRSHTHFFEVNRALAFDRASTYGFRLDLPSGVGMRFEPGFTRRVKLVAMGGAREIHGVADMVGGALDAPGQRDLALDRARASGHLLPRSTATGHAGQER